MGRVEVKVAGTDHHVFNVWRFENEHPRRAQYPERLCNQLLQHRERNVLGDVKATDRYLATIGELA
ncbi:hypothetical protein D3C76_1818480 [compost metagenome]